MEALQRRLRVADPVPHLAPVLGPQLLGLAGRVLLRLLQLLELLLEGQHLLHERLRLLVRHAGGARQAGHHPVHGRRHLVERLHGPFHVALGQLLLDLVEPAHEVLRFGQLGQGLLVHVLVVEALRQLGHAREQVPHLLPHAPHLRQERFLRLLGGRLAVPLHQLGQVAALLGEVLGELDQVLGPPLVEELLQVEDPLLRGALDGGVVAVDPGQRQPGLVTRPPAAALVERLLGHAVGEGEPRAAADHALHREADVLGHVLERRRDLARAGRVAPQVAGGLAEVIGHEPGPAVDRLRLREPLLGVHLPLHAQVEPVAQAGHQLLVRLARALQHLPPVLRLGVDADELGVGGGELGAGDRVGVRRLDAVGEPLALAELQRADGQPVGARVAPHRVAGAERDALLGALRRLQDQVHVAEPDVVLGLPDHLDRGGGIDLDLLLGRGDLHGREGVRLDDDGDGRPLGEELALGVEEPEPVAPALGHREAAGEIAPVADPERVAARDRRARGVLRLRGGRLGSGLRPGGRPGPRPLRRRRGRRPGRGIDLHVDDDLRRRHHPVGAGPEIDLGALGSVDFAARAGERARLPPHVGGIAVGQLDVAGDGIDLDRRAGRVAADHAEVGAGEGRAPHPERRQVDREHPDEQRARQPDRSVGERAGEIEGPGAGRGPLHVGVDQGHRELAPGGDLVARGGQLDRALQGRTERRVGRGHGPGRGPVAADPPEDIPDREDQGGQEGEARTRERHVPEREPRPGRQRQGAGQQAEERCRRAHPRPGQEGDPHLAAARAPEEACDVGVCAGHELRASPGERRSRHVFGG